MTGRFTILAAILTVFQIVVSNAHARAPEDDVAFLAYGATEQHQVRYHHKRIVREKVSPPVIKKQEVVDNSLVRARGLELVSRMRKDLGTNPSGWSSLWCGRYLSMVTGRNGKRSVNLASNWQHEGTPAPKFAVGSVGVSEGHVLVVAPGGHCPSGTFNSISGNSVGRLVSYMCANRASYYSFRWVSIANSQIAAKIPLPRSRPEFPPLPIPNPEPRVYETALPPQTQPIVYDAFDTYIFPPAEIVPVPSPTFVRTGPFVMSVRPETMQPGDIDKIVERDEIASYLWQVYQRTPRKVDQTGDFSWKDPAAAKRAGMSLPQYVIGGLARSTQKAFYKAGRAMDAAGIRWSILSAFRDDWRQKVAAGIKACNSCSLHGGSRFGGYGNGMAIDVTTASGDTDQAANWLARNGRKYGLVRPYPGFDPFHIQVVERVAHLKPWRWFASTDEPRKPKIAVAKIIPMPEYALNDMDRGAPIAWSVKPENPVQVASIGKEIPLTGTQKIYQLVRDEAAKYKLDAKHLMYFAFLENNRLSDGVNSASGLFGLMPSERRRMAQKDNTLASQVKAGVKHVHEDYTALKAALKREPTPEQTYTAHWLGIGAGVSVIKASDTDSLRMAIDRGEPGLGAKAIAGNPALQKMRNVGDFRRALDIRMREAKAEIRV